MGTSEDAITRYARAIKKLPTVMRMEIDYNVHTKMWYVTVMDQRWSLQRGIAHPSLEQALRLSAEDLK